MTRAYLGGTFDIVHSGHIKLFRWAAENFDEVIVSVNTDNFVERYKGIKPVLNEDERMEVIAAIEYVTDVVFNLGDEDSRVSIVAVEPTHIVNGMDWTVERLKKQMMLDDEFLAKNNLTIVIAPTPQALHSSDIKKKILGTYNG